MNFEGIRRSLVPCETLQDLLQCQNVSGRNVAWESCINCCPVRTSFWIFLSHLLLDLVLRYSRCWRGVGRNRCAKWVFIYFFLQAMFFFIWVLRFLIWGVVFISCHVLGQIFLSSHCTLQYFFSYKLFNIYGSIWFHFR